MEIIEPFVDEIGSLGGGKRNKHSDNDP